MADEIYINTGSSFQQPYQGQSVRNAQSLEVRQTPAQTPANARQPSTYQNRQPFTYRSPVNAQTPFIRNAQQPFTYQNQGRTPFTYNYRSPFTYARQGQTPFTYARQGRTPYVANAQQPYPYIANNQTPYIANAQQPYPYIANKQSPYIANGQSPYIANAQSPYIANAQQPYPYIASYQSPFTYNHRQPFTYARQGRSPFTYSNQQPYPYIAQTPYTYNKTGTQTISPLDQSWGPSGGSHWVTHQSVNASAGFPEAWARMAFSLDTANDQVDVNWAAGTSAAFATVYYDSIGYQSPVTDSSTFEVKYTVASQECIGSCYVGSFGPTPVTNGYNSGTYYSLSSGKTFGWMAKVNPNYGPDYTRVQTGFFGSDDVTFTVRATPSGSSNSYITTYTGPGIDLYASLGSIDPF
jgi:hypothetical protein